MLLRAAFYQMMNFLAEPMTLNSLFYKFYSTYNNYLYFQMTALTF